MIVNYLFFLINDMAFWEIVMSNFMLFVDIS